MSDLPLEPHRRFLWGLAYRLTGNGADADDIVQETFLRAIAHAPADARPSDGEAGLRPWLVRVALNLGRDELRRRKRRHYDGPWLPPPEELDLPGPDDDSPAARYDRLESVTLAFLLALEALSPNQRAALLLRDVFDYSVRETAAALDISEANVKTTHLRARRALRDYDARRTLPTEAWQRRTRLALERFLGCLREGDVAGAEALLARDCRALSDGGGEFHAARQPVVGSDRVTRLFAGMLQRAGAGARAEWGSLNGLPALRLHFAAAGPAWAPRGVLQCALAADGQIAQMFIVVASAKLVRAFGHGT